jgi:hypothetical protein
MVKVNVKISQLQAVEAPRVARGQGSHITYTNGSQMAARSSALRRPREGVDV